MLKLHLGDRVRIKNTYILIRMMDLSTDTRTMFFLFSLLWAAAVIAGLYVVLWGKADDMISEKWQYFIIIIM